MAMRDEHPEPYDEFHRRLVEARAEDYPGLDPHEFRRMKEYLLNYYGPGKPIATSVRGGQVIDIIPFDQQLAVRQAAAAGHPIPTPPPHLHARAAPPGPIERPRITLEQLARYGTLDAYFRKAPPPRPVHAARPPED
jgi:hypothetical protein